VGDAQELIRFDGNTNLVNSSAPILIEDTLKLESGQITDTTGTINFGNENLVTTGDMTADELTLTNPSIDYKFTTGGTANGLGITTTTGQHVRFQLTPFDTAGAKNVYFEIYGKGNAGSTANIEQIRMGYQSTGLFAIWSLAYGTGTLRPIQIGVGDYIQTQLVLNTDGSINALPTYSNPVSGTIKPLYMNTSGQIGYDPSSELFKDNIKNASSTDWLYDLRVVDFDYKDGGLKSRTGLIAEEVELIDPRLVTYKLNITKECFEDEDGEEVCEVTDIKETDEVDSVSYSSQIMISSMIKEMQELKTENDLIKSCAKDSPDYFKYQVCVAGV